MEVLSPLSLKKNSAYLFKTLDELLNKSRMSRAEIRVNVSRCCYQVIIHGGWGEGSLITRLVRGFARGLTLMMSVCPVCWEAPTLGG